MAVKGIRYTCTAGRFATSSFECDRGFVTTMHPDDPRNELFKDNPSFKSEPCYIENYMGTDDSKAEHTPAAEVTSSGGGDESVEASVGDMADSVEELPGIPKDIPAEIIAKLIESGYHTVGDAMGAGVAELIEIHGIGEKTAVKIIAACKTYLGHDDTNSEDDNSGTGVDENGD